MKNIFHRTDIYKFRSKFDRKKSNLSFPFLFFFSNERKVITPRTTQSKLFALIEACTCHFFLALQNSFQQKKSNNPRMTQLESFLARRLNVSFSFLFSYLPECIRFLSPFLFRLETLLSFHQRFSRGFFLSLSLARSGQWPGAAGGEVKIECVSRSPAASISNRSAREAITLEKVNVTLEGFVRVAQPLSVPGYVRFFRHFTWRNRLFRE